MAFQFNQHKEAPSGGAPNTGRFFKSLSRSITIIVLLAALIVLGSLSFAVIDEGYIGVKYQFGRIVDTSLSAGLNLKIPFIQSIRIVDIREQMYEMDTTAYTMDTQTVENLQVKLNYIYDKALIGNLIRNVGVANVETKLIIPQMQSTMKNAIGQVRAEDLVQNRAAVQESIEETLRNSLGNSGITVISFAMENLDFEDGFEETIRAKVAAEQQALTMQNKTKEKEELAKQAVIEAQAQADSEKIKSDAQAYAIETIQKQLNQSPEYIQYQQVQRWDGKLPQVMSETVNPFVSFQAAPQ
ncbi:MAG: prohibitin family protein [Candidatus Fimivivens sp.]